MTLEEAIKYFGSEKLLRKALNLTNQGFWYWKRVGYIPLLAQFLIQETTKGKLKASKSDIKPKEVK